MNILPKVKEFNINNGVCDANSLNWKFTDGTDERVINAAFRISESPDGTPVYISHNSENGEGYTLDVDGNEIKIEAESAAGAFYALSTLKMLIKSNNGTLKVL